MITSIFLKVILSFSVISWSAFEVQGISVWDDITLTQREKNVLDEFKVIMNDTVPYDWMRTDIYLIKWLRARNLNIPDAERMLRQHLKWRKELRIDTIEEENFGLLEFEYPYTTDGVDYEGRPVLALNAADWDVRRALISGQRDKVIRWAFRAYEIGSKKIRKMQAEGQNVTQFIMVCNFDGFNLVQHVCLECVEFYVNFLAAYELQYPGMADAIIAIKTPSTFEIVLQALKTVMSKETQDAIKIWGTNRDQWQKNILTKIPADQLDEEFGGTREPSY